MAISLQRSGLTGRRMMNPPSPGRSILGMRQVSAPAAAPTAGPAPSATPDIGPKIGLGEGGAPSGTPGFTGGVPNEVPDSGLDPEKAKSYAKKAAGLYGVNAAMMGPVHAAPVTAGQLLIGGIGSKVVAPAAKWVYKKAKNALGLGRSATDAYDPATMGPLGSHFGLDTTDPAAGHQNMPNQDEALDIPVGGLSPHFGVGEPGIDEAGPMPGPSQDRGWFGDGFSAPGDDDTPIG